MGRRKAITLTSAKEYWPFWEVRLRSLDDVRAWIAKPGGVWRGQEDSDWGMTTSLHRRLGATASETRQAAYVERTTSNMAERAPWTASAGTIHKLSLLQHYGAASPLLDVTLNPLVALAFAVKPLPILGRASEPDGRLFRFAPEQYDELTDTEALRADWAALTDPRLDRRGRPQRPVRLYRPDPLDPRISAQSGAFLFGRLPAKRYFGSGQGRFPLDPGNSSYFNQAEHRLVWSQYVRCHKDTIRGAPPKFSIRTARVEAAIKPVVRGWLKGKGFGPVQLFPDLQGQATWIDRDW